MGAEASKQKAQGGVDNELLQQYFTQVGKTQTLGPGATLIKQGSPSESVYFLVEGSTVLKKYNASGNAKEIGTRGAGQVIGVCHLQSAAHAHGHLSLHISSGHTATDGPRGIPGRLIARGDACRGHHR